MNLPDGVRVAAGSALGVDWLWLKRFPELY